MLTSQIESISQNLERDFKLFIDQPDHFDFFVGLAEYTGYILETPTLKAMADKVLAKKHSEYDELAELEDKTMKELLKAKHSLFKVVADCGLARNSFKGHWSSTIPDYSLNLLDEIDRLEKDGFGGHSFASDTLASYLFDLAVGITTQGHHNAIKEFVVNETEYRKYTDGVDNIRGRFIFSKTLPLRQRKSHHIERVREFELWAAFDGLVLLRHAFLAVSSNLTEQEILAKYGQQVRHKLEAQDAVNVIFAAEDLKKMSIRTIGVLVIDSQWYMPHITHIQLHKFKGFASRVHTHLTKELSQASSMPQERPIEQSSILLYLDSFGNLWREPRIDFCYSMIEAKERLNIVRFLQESQGSGYIQTAQIAKTLDKGVGYIRSEIGKINIIAKNRLGIGMKLLDSK